MELPEPVESAVVSPWIQGEASPAYWWLYRWVRYGWIACMITAVLWYAIPLDLPHPTGYLLYGLGFAPWLHLGIYFVRRSLTEGTTFDMIRAPDPYKPRWIRRTRHRFRFWANVAGVGGFSSWVGVEGVQALWIGLLDLATLTRIWITGPL